MEQYLEMVEKTAQTLRDVLRPRTVSHVLRIMRFYGYSYVRQVPLLNRGKDVSLSPNVSFRNAERISIGDRTHVGERSIIWAGDARSCVRIGSDCLLAPNVTITSSNYGTVQGLPIMRQARIEEDINIGDDVWLGANAVVLAGISIGSGAIVGAGAVVTRDLPANCIAVGIPATVVGFR